MADKGILLRTLAEAPGTGPLPDDYQTYVENPAGKSYRSPVARVRGAGTGTPGTGGGVLTASLPVSLLAGKLGGVKNGDVLTPGTTYEEVFRKLLIETIFPTYNTASASLVQTAPQDGEAGEAVANTLTLTFNRGDAGALTSDQINKDGVRISTAGTTSPFQRNSNVVRTLTPIVYQGFVSYAAGTAKNVTPGNTPDTRPAQIRNSNAPQAAETNLGSNTVAIIGYYRLFYGPSGSAPTDSATTRSLPQSQLTNAGNSGTLNTGTTALKLAIVLPPGRTLQSVTDIDNQGLNLTSKYVAQPTISVNDAGGNAVPGYTPYVLSIATPYTASARHVFTYA